MKIVLGLIILVIGLVLVGVGLSSGSGPILPQADHDGELKNIIASEASVGCTISAVGVVLALTGLGVLFLF